VASKSFVMIMVLITDLVTNTLAGTISAASTIWHQSELISMNYLTPSR